MILTGIRRERVEGKWVVESAEEWCSVVEGKGRAPSTVKECRIFNINIRGRRGCTGVSVYLSVFTNDLASTWLHHQPRDPIWFPDEVVSFNYWIRRFRVRVCCLADPNTPSSSLKGSRRPAKLKDNKEGLPSKRNRSIRAWNIFWPGWKGKSSG